MIEMLTAVVLAMFVAPGMGAGERTREQREALRHYRAGQEALAGERYEEAVREFQSAARLDPLLVPAFYGEGQAHMALKEYAEAVRAYTQCREAFHQEEANALTNRLDAARRLDDHIKLLEDDLRYLQRVSAGNNAQSQRAQHAALTTGEQIRALKSRRMRSTDAPEPTPAWLSLALGSAYFRGSDLVRAEEHYKEAVEVQTNLGEAHNNLAVVYMLTGRLKEAESEILAAEKAGFQVNPQLKKDLAARKGGVGR